MSDRADRRRFFDTRAAYMMFVTATDEKPVVADRVGLEASRLKVGSPGLRVLDAGMGDASLLAHLLRNLHRLFPHIPWLVVGKEISIEDVRQALAKLPDRFLEHPEMVFVVTNMAFAEAPRLAPRDPSRHVAWRVVALDGGTTHGFTDQIRSLYEGLAADWAVETSAVSGNPLYRTPCVLVLYRADHEFLLRPLIPSPGSPPTGYDLVVASQTYRSRTPLEEKVRNVLLPLAQALATGGRMVGVQARGDDPGLEIIRGVWPGEEPFPHGRKEVLDELRRQLDASGDGSFHLDPLPDDESLLRFRVHTMPSEEVGNIGTSSLVAAFTSAAYVAQIDEQRLNGAMASGAYLEATAAVVKRHGAVWFADETFLVTRER